MEAEGDYTEGDYTEGDYTEGDYTEGDYTEGDYTEGDYTEGDYTEGDYTTVKEKFDKALIKSKKMLTDFKLEFEDYVDYDDYKDVIIKLENHIFEMEEKSKTFKINLKPNWEIIQQRYDDHCNTFSPAYLSGCEWYQIIGKDFKKGFTNLEITEYLLNLSKETSS